MKNKKITFDGVNSSEMTREQMLSFCWKHKDEFIRDYDKTSEGIRSFDCLISLVEDESFPFTPLDLHKHGMSDQMMAICHGNF